MKNSNLIIVGILLVSIIFAGFDCTSTELTSAKLYIQQKNYEKAIEVLQQEIKKNPKSDEGYYLLGQVYAVIDSLDKMVEAFDNSLAISNKYQTDIEKKKYEIWSEIMHSGSTYYNRSVITSDDDSVKILLDKAIPEFQSATIVEPDSALGYHFLAISFLRKSEYTQAVDPLKKLIEIDQDEVGYQYLGEVYYSFGEDSKNEFKTSKNSTDSIKAINYFNEAINTLEAGLLKYPNNSDMLTYRTNAYINTGRIEEAITSAKALVEQDPTNALYHYNYGVLLMNVDKLPEAENELKKVIELDPENEDAIYNIGVTYVKWGTAMNKEAEKEGIMSEEYKQKYEAALPYLEKVVEVDPTNIAIWELLGKVYSVLGMTDDANNAFKKADELR